jgi:Fe-S-cluster containining protein
MDTVSFKCTACGKCCNWPPLMSLPELFHHESLFVGCLGLRRVQRVRPGQEMAAGEQRVVLSSDDAREMNTLAGGLLYSPGGGNYDIAITSQATDYELLHRCPALLDDHRCSIHEDRKPTICSMVPIDALYPDRLQHAVVLSRQFEQGCIVRGRKAGSDVVVEDGQVPATEYKAALNRRRREMAHDRKAFGEPVFEMLRQDLFAHPREAERIPFDGHSTLTLIPALLVIAGVSATYRARCAQYVDAQLTLIQTKIQAALDRKYAADKPMTRERSEALRLVSLEEPRYERSTGTH